MTFPLSYGSSHLFLFIFIIISEIRLFALCSSSIVFAVHLIITLTTWVGPFVCSISLKVPFSFRCQLAKMFNCRLLIWNYFKIERKTRLKRRAGCGAARRERVHLSAAYYGALSVRLYCEWVELRTTTAPKRQGKAKERESNTRAGPSCDPLVDRWTRYEQQLGLVRFIYFHWHFFNSNCSATKK